MELHASYAVDLLPSMVLLGLAGGLCLPALMTLAMSGATPEEAGLASGLVNTDVQVGGALGLSVPATLASTRSANLLAAGEHAASALIGGYHLAWLVSTAIAAGTLALAAAWIRSVRLDGGSAADPEQIAAPTDAAVAFERAA